MCKINSSIGKLVRAREMSGTTKKLGVQNIYDSFGRISQSSYDIGSVAHEYSVTYRDDSGIVSSFSMTITETSPKSIITVFLSRRMNTMNVTSLHAKIMFMRTRVIPIPTI
ncbi:MAG: hypothetical protein A2Y17_01490 [Clostridiales bacterium GWF2_38_85]|nr:MAG: hypothetical protein A2Y17_01490 [Clostridiales bacterium GWF2_38_85]HBL84818.1 hypothetical protein [Clostridiales bacterium]